MGDKVRLTEAGAAWLRTNAVAGMEAHVLAVSKDGGVEVEIPALNKSKFNRSWGWVLTPSCFEPIVVRKFNVGDKVVLNRDPGLFSTGAPKKGTTGVVTGYFDYNVVVLMDCAQPKNFCGANGWWFGESELDAAPVVPVRKFNVGDKVRLTRDVASTQARKPLKGTTGVVVSRESNATWITIRTNSAQPTNGNGNGWIVNVDAVEPYVEPKPLVGDTIRLTAKGVNYVKEWVVVPVDKPITGIIVGVDDDDDNEITAALAIPHVERITNSWPLDHEEYEVVRPGD